MLYKTLWYEEPGLWTLIFLAEESLDNFIASINAGCHRIPITFEPLLEDHALHTVVRVLDIATNSSTFYKIQWSGESG
jgi:hypothetical protein